MTVVRNIPAILHVFRHCEIEFVLDSLGSMFNKNVFSEIVRISLLGPLSFCRFYELQWQNLSYSFLNVIFLEMV